MRALVVVAMLSSAAAADPAPPLPLTSPAPRLTLDAALAAPPTPHDAPSLRIESARIVAERLADSWRYPEPGGIVGVDGRSWYLGAGYVPRTARSAALHAGSIGATLLGEILLSTDSPLAGLGALAAGATLDAAAADVDRAAEAAAR